ncbi:MAG TPA: SDR family NAD(P)-dependent oxidoreductase, partial [Chloroflexota bacterium]|nr:SDR family NAD(P)-dependent oxidoreductase [Chloroflexota bacterium]
MSIEGKVAIVTGASLGIGAGIAKRLAKDGAKVVITARRPRPLQETANIIKNAGGTVLAVTADAGVAADVENVFKQVLDTWGTVDIVVNNAGWASPIAHILEMDQNHWDTVIRTNLTSIYLHCHRAANIMVDQGVKGAIVNISS